MRTQRISAVKRHVPEGNARMNLSRRTTVAAKAAASLNAKRRYWFSIHHLVLAALQIGFKIGPIKIQEPLLQQNLQVTQVGFSNTWMRIISKQSLIQMLNILDVAEIVAEETKIQKPANIMFVFVRLQQ